MAKFATTEPLVSRLARRPDASLNYEDALAFVHDAKHTLAHTAACCLVDEQAFYEDTTSKIDELVQLVAREDPAWLIKLAIYIRTELHLRSMPIRIAAIAATIPECREFLLMSASRILIRPDDVLEFASLLKDNRYGLSDHLPSVAKKIIAERLNSLDEIRAIKYRRGSGFGLKHLLKLSHPAPSDRRQDVIFSYLLEPARWEQLPEEDKALVPRISAYEALKRLPKKHHQTARRLVRENDLPWELVVPLLGSDARIWATVAPVMPIMALTRNLRNLIISGAMKSPAVRSAVINRLTDPDVIRGSMMLPFRWLSARNALSAFFTERGIPTDTGFALKLDEALNRAIELSTDCLPRWPGKTVIACDLSGSMHGCPISEYSTMFPIDIACILSSIAHRLCDDHVLYAFAEKITRFSTTPGEGLLESTARLRDIDVGHCTYGYKVVEDLVKNRDFVDRMVFLTDMELYSESPSLHDGNDLRSLFARYQRSVNKKVDLFVVNLAAYGHFITPQGDGNVTYISGWSEGILRYISTFGSGFDLVSHIGSLSL